MKPCILATGLMLVAAPAPAEDFEMRILRGSVQLGGDFTIAIRGDAPLQEDARCLVELPPPFDGHVSQQTDDCAQLRITQKTVPIRDDAGYAIPSEQVPAVVRILSADGAEIGRVDTMFPYHNQFTELRVLIRDVRNPVAAGQSFEAEVQGAGQPIDPSLTCRWNTYGPVEFVPSSENRCRGTLTALQPTGRDADMDVQIVNMVDMHAVGYATASMIVE